MVDVVREACAAGHRVWWVGLPHQRPYVFRRVTAGGRAVLGLEVVGAQQAYYRVLSAAAPQELRPLVVGTARVVLVAEALRRALGREPSASGSGSMRLKTMLVAIQSRSTKS